jgi:ribonuclease-3
VSTDLIRHAFADPTLLQRALTHRSAGSRNNERLEFLGDALVNLIVAEALYQRWPRADEGELTRARAQLVRESSLAGLARELELGDRLDLGPGELKSGGFRRDSILADAFEALVAAIYLDAGFEACRERVLAWFRGLIEGLTPMAAPKRTPRRACRNGCRLANCPCPNIG